MSFSYDSYHTAVGYPNTQSRSTLGHLAGPLEVVLVVEFQICTEQDIIIRLINVHVLIIMYALPCKSRLNVRAPFKTTALETHEYRDSHRSARSISMP